jgi:hypothetical protein
MKFSVFAIASIMIIGSSCRALVSDLKPIDDKAQNRHAYDTLSLEYIETRTARQVGSPIIIADVLLEAKAKFGNVTITNIREQQKRHRGQTTYYLIYDVVKVKN